MNAPFVAEKTADDRFENEVMLLGGLLVNSSVSYSAAAAIVDPSHFSDPFNAKLFKIIGSAVEAGLDGFRRVHHVISELRHASELEELKVTASELVAKYIGRCAPQIALEGCARQVRYDHLMVLLERATEDGDMAEVERVAAEMERLSKAHLTQDEGIESIGQLSNRLLTRLNDAYMAGEPVKDFAYCGSGDLGDLLGGWRRKRLYIIAGRPGMGKEQPVSTPVLTPSGWKPIGDVRAGDYVIGSDGKPTKVIAINPQGYKTAYRVIFSDGTSTRCGLNHLWTVFSSGGRSRNVGRTLSLAELLRKGLCHKKRDGRKGAKWRVPVCSPVQYSVSDALPIAPYVLGVLIGDGALTGRDVRFSNPDIDGDIRERVRTLLPQSAALRENRSSACPYYVVTGESRAEIKDAIQSLGLAVLSAAKRIPERYLTASPEDRLELLRGLMDTDGSSMGGKTVFYTTSSGLSEDVASLVRSLGGVARISKYERSDEGKSTEYVVRVRISECPFYTSRKAATWNPPPLSRYITDVVVDGMEDQVCISVAAADGLYLTNDFIVTHNSTVALSMLLRTASRGHGVMFFALEMGREELTEMALCSLSWNHDSRVEYRDISAAAVGREGFAQKLERVLQTSQKLGSMPFFIGDRGGLTVAEVRSQALQYSQRLAAEGKKLEVIVIDHMGHMKASERYAGNKVSETEEISSGLKMLAKELDCAVIALAQINRGVEGREDKRPALADLRWSGSIEQDADVVIFVYREAYYLERIKHDDVVDEDQRLVRLGELKNRIELLIAKHRGGPCGNVEMYCDMGCAVIRDSGVVYG